MNKRVLIIDDEPDIILTLRMALERNGFRTNSISYSILAYKRPDFGVVAASVRLASFPLAPWETVGAPVL
jgi:DNA-binding NtrC family response regulator